MSTQKPDGVRLKVRLISDHSRLTSVRLSESEIENHSVTPRRVAYSL